MRVKRLLTASNMGKAALLGTYLALSYFGLKWIAAGDVTDNPAAHLINGRLRACLWLSVVGFLAAGIWRLLQCVWQKKAFSSAGVSQGFFPWQASDGLFSVGAGAALSLLVSLLAEDYARVMEAAGAFSMERWLPVFALCWACFTWGFRFYKTNAAFRLALVCPGLVVLFTSRWFSGYVQSAKLFWCWFFLLACGWALGALARGKLGHFIKGPWFAALYAIAAAIGTFFLDFGE